MKTWREETRLATVSPENQIEIVCRRCGNAWYQWPAELMERDDMRQLYMDEIQRALACYDRFCNGDVKIALLWDHLNEGFEGGMP